MVDHKRCSTQLADGSFCERKVVLEGKCFWHSRLPKTDEGVRKYTPEYQSLAIAIESEKSNLQKAVFSKLSLSGTDFSGSVLIGAQFHYCDLTESDFSRANLRSVSFKNCRMQGAILTEAVLDKGAVEQTDLQLAKLDRASFVNARIIDSILSYATCRETFFQSTQFAFVDMKGADILTAHFSERNAQLKLCNVDGEDLPSYLQGVALEWVQSPRRHEALRIVQYLESKLSSDQFRTWVRQLSLSLLDSFQLAQIKPDLKELADIYEFLARLYKVLGYMPSVLALPGQTSVREKTEGSFLHLKATLAGDTIGLPEFTQYCESLKRFVEVCQRTTVLTNHVSEGSQANIVYLSLSSPLEMIVVITGLASAASATILFILKVIREVQEIVVNSLRIEKEKLEVQLKKQQAATQQIEKARLLEIENKLKDRIQVPAEHSLQLAAATYEFLQTIHKSETFVDYTVSIQDSEISIKTAKKKVRKGSRNNALPKS